ncbi:hypothetical protein [Halapricum desulfuricans]|uniref:Putative membrane protein n=1 Tax=Halapricum desulfuricans TaxID=2841257 RepID=A0A897NUU7_9EURY|nr:hypothetical protein [Halapricum desulfuricans]QSG16021.1 putative membrane protein [Halapricum desulfuricans]
MNPQRRGAVLWGLVAALAFLVLLQGYELLADRRTTLLVKFGVAAAVGLVAAATTWSLAPRLSRI